MRVQAEAVVRPVTVAAEVQMLLVSGFATDLTRLAVQAAPTILVQADHLLRVLSKAVLVETLAA